METGYSFAELADTHLVLGEGSGYAASATNEGTEKMP
jgi:hypothetical protein